MAAVTSGTDTEDRVGTPVATWLLVGAGICAAIALVFFGRTTAFLG